MKRFLAIVAVVAVSGSASAFTVRGYGTIPCREFNNGQDWTSKIQWLLGFVSGSEAWLKPDITTGTSAVKNNDVVQAVAMWCRQNPNAELGEAALAAVRAMNR